MRQTLIVIFGTLLSVFLLGFILSRVEMDLFIRTMEQVHYGYIFLSSGVFILAFYLRAIRWRELIYEHRDIEINAVMSAMSIGFMVNNLFPVRFGEILRAWLLGWKKNISKSFVLSTVLVERVMDFGVLIIFLLLAVPYVDLPAYLHKAVYGMFATGGFLVAIVVIFHLSRHSHAKWLRRVGEIFPERYSEQIASVSGSFLKGLAVYQHPVRFLKILILSLVLWVLWGIGFVLALKGFELTIPVSGVLLAAVIINVGLVLPSSPGYVGTYHFLCVVSLGLVGIEASRAFGFSIVFHALWYLPYTAIGIWYLWRENLSLSYLWKAGKDMTAKTGGTA